MVQCQHLLKNIQWCFLELQLKLHMNFYTKLFQIAQLVLQVLSLVSNLYMYNKTMIKICLAFILWTIQEVNDFMVVLNKHMFVPQTSLSNLSECIKVIHKNCQEVMLIFI